MNDTLITLKTITAARHEGLEAVNELFEALHANGVQYCHWKSNIRLVDSLEGKTDLDLLVNRAHSQIMRQILLEQDIKQISPPSGQQYPGIEHYLGFDQDSGRLFHLHVHYQLVLGEAFIKNFRLPLEKVFLEQTHLLKGIFVPVPELEIAVLAIRILLKYRLRDAIKDIFSIRSPGIKKYFQDEINWLLEQTSIEKISKTLTSVAPTLPSNIILEFLDTLHKTPRNGRKLVSLQKSLRKALHPYQRHNSLIATYHYLQELWGRRKSFRITSPTTGLKLPQGGLTIALLGADGSGKSTLSKEISQWLSWKLVVKRYYLGSKQPSIMSRYFYLAFRIARRMQRAVAGAVSSINSIANLFASLRDNILYLHYLSIGRDRSRRYEKGTTYATDGSVVIFDRFPISSLKMPTNSHLLDGPAIQELSSSHPTVFSKRLSEIEQSIYQKMEIPDVLVFLDVSPEVSIHRKPDHNEEIIRIKSRTIAQLAELSRDYSDPNPYIIINADLPYEQVLLRDRKSVV